MTPGAERTDSQRSDSGQRYKKLTINLTPDHHADLAAMADARGCTITDLIKAALALDRYLWEHRHSELLMRDPSTDEVRQIIIIRP